MAQHRNPEDRPGGRGPRGFEQEPFVEERERRDLKGLSDEFFRDMRQLLSQESRLIRQEMSEKAQLIKTSGITMSAGFVVSMMALQALVATIVIALAYRMPWWGAALLTTVLLGIIGLTLIAVGRKKISKENLKPTRSIDTLNEISDRFEEKVHEYKPSA
jgi:hypothetical protein